MTKKIRSSISAVIAAAVLLCLPSCGKKGEKPDNAISSSAPTETEAVLSTTETAAEPTEAFIHIPKKDYNVTFNGKYSKVLSPSDHITIRRYKGFEVTYNGKSKEDICAEVSKLGENYYQEIHEGTVSYGDTINIDFTTYVGDSELSEPRGTDYLWEIGGGDFLDVFGMDMNGDAIGSTVEKSVRFPDNYFVSDLSGVKAVIKIKINYKKSFENQKADDAFIAKYTNGEYSTIDAYCDHLYDQSVINAVKDECFEKAFDALKKEDISYDDETVEELINEQRASDEKLAASLEIKPNEFYKMDESEYEAHLTEAAQTYFTKIMLLYAIAALEDVSLPDDSEINEYAEAAAAERWISTEQYIESVGKENIREAVFFDKVSVVLAKGAVIVDRITEKDEKDREGTEIDKQ